jgi:hypothetical protein
MTDREMVIEGLEMSYRYSNVDENNTLVPQQLVLDALALLKAQEPRLVTVEEVVGCVILKRNITLWFEFRNEIKAMNAKDIVYNDFLCDEDFPTLSDPNLEWADGGKRDGVIIAEYNDTFRCWTSRPTDEQRGAVKWELPTTKRQ